MMPLVTVLMNCFNGEKFLTKAIQSVLDQTYQNWELVFWDNCSTDRSAEEFHSFADSRLHYFLAPHHTVLYEARNYALEHSQGSLIAFLDVDDWWDTDKLEQQVRLFNNPEVGFVYGNFWLENEKNGTTTLASKSILPEGRGVDALLAKYPVGMLTLMVRKSIFHGEYGSFDPRFQILGDFDLVIRLACFTEYGVVQNPIAHYRWHGDNLTTKSVDRHLSELELWLHKIEKSPIIFNSPAIVVLRDLYRYKLGQSLALSGNRWKSFQTLLAVKNWRMQFRLLGYLLLPVVMHHWVRT
jgi:glycosyltransferase involved in cell wall biosynthesis